MALVPLSLLPALALFVIRATASSRRLRVALSAGAIALLLLVAVGYGDFTPDRVRELRDVRTAYRGFIDDHNRDEISPVLARIRSLDRPGESLFVGPPGPSAHELRSHLPVLPASDLKPASYYMEMNPGTANREGSGLADDLRDADWLILTSEWDDWNEPNESRDFRPVGAEQCCPRRILPSP